MSAAESGSNLAKMTREPFASRDDRDLWYDSLPYLSSTNAEERRLLAALTCREVPEESRDEIKGSWSEADILAASGHTLEAMSEITRIFDSASGKIVRD